jgi:hypothetical protein
MSGINLSMELAQVSSNIELVQSEIAAQENQMDSLMNNRDGLASQDSMSAVQVYIAQLRASLGAFRSQESYLKQELEEEKQSRKMQNELGKG